MITTVAKIGSMALINKERNDIDLAVFERIAKELTPGSVLVTSGAVEIGKIDYIKRIGHEICIQGGKEIDGGVGKIVDGGLKGKEIDGSLFASKYNEAEAIKADYAAQGQAVLMKIYREFVDEKYGVRQILVEHEHFNNKKKCEHIRQVLLRASTQGCIPIVNYNDAVSFEEVRKMEIQNLKAKDEQIVELVDNDETASQIALITGAKNLIILTSTDGIYLDPHDAKTLVREISGDTPQEVVRKITDIQAYCIGASRIGANGAFAKLEYIKEVVASGTCVYIASSKYSLSEISSGAVPSTKIWVRMG